MRKDETENACPETLGEYWDFCRALGGNECRACQFLDKKIKDSPNGRAEIVIVADSQMRLLLMPMLLSAETES